MKKIAIIGNFSGRNAGDAAILGGLLNDVYGLYPNVQFIVPTINKSFVESAYKSFPVKAVPLMPWNLSLKILGLPIIRTVLGSDLILLTDAILFDRKLWNPLVNYLSTMALVLPLAKGRKIPVVLYNMSLGPITSTWGKTCIQKVLNCAKLIIVRDKESIGVLRNVNWQSNGVIVAADSALNISALNPFKSSKLEFIPSTINENDRYISFNVTSYIDTWLKKDNKGIGKTDFVRIMASTIVRIVDKLGLKILMVITQLMDLGIAREILRKANRPSMASMISNKYFSFNEIAGFISKAEMHVGMRTHSLIFAGATCTPVVAIVTYPKNRGFMESIRQDSRMLYLDHWFSSDSLFGLVKKTFEERERIRSELAPIIKRKKEQAKMSAKYLKDYL